MGIYEAVTKQLRTAYTFWKGGTVNGVDGYPTLDANGFPILTATGTTGAEGVYPIKAPPKVAFPYVTYAKVSDQRENTLDGGSVDLVQARFQVNVWSNTFTQARSLAEATKKILLHHKDLARNPPVIDILLDNDLDLYEEDTNIFHVVLDFVVNYYERD